jgi:hypothetical protein
MASVSVTWKNFTQLILGLDRIKKRKLTAARLYMTNTGIAMLNDFRAGQQIGPTGEGKGVRNTNAKVAAALQFVDAHLDDPIPGRGIPWTNRSHLAMRGVHTYIEETDKEITLGLVQTRFYGAYLEFAHNGRYAVIRPLMAKYAANLAADAAGAVKNG